MITKGVRRATRNVTRAATRAARKSTSVSYDTDAKDYFDRVTASGGSFDQTSINAIYNELYVKGKFNDLITSLKTASLWTKIYEIYPLCGPSAPGLLDKLKYVSAPKLVNTGGNFVSGDYTPVGANLGLKGNGTNKSLDTGYNLSWTGTDWLAFGTCVTQYVAANGAFMGNRTAASANIYQLDSLGTSNAPRAFVGLTGSASFADVTSQILIATRQSATLMKIIIDGVARGTQAVDVTTAAFPVANLRLFSYYLDGTGEQQFSQSRMAMPFVAKGLSDVESASLSTIFNTFLAALGTTI